MRRAAALGLAAIAGVSLHWVAVLSERVALHILDFWANEPNPEHHVGGEHLLLLLVGAGLFAWSSVTLYQQRRHLFGTRQVDAHVATERDARSCLIFLVSRQRRFDPKSQGLVERLRRDPATGAFTVPGVVVPEFPLTGDLGKDILALDALPPNHQWPWQQILRAIEPHRASLERIWLVGSMHSDGSQVELPLCRDWLQSYGLRAEIRMDETKDLQGNLGVEFEDYDNLLERLELLIRQEKELSGSEDDRRIAIDATGGQKTTSIAAAAATLNSDAIFQYVQTGGRKQVLVYNITYDNPLLQGEH
jgi:hypothetical protein